MDDASSIIFTTVFYVIAPAAFCCIVLLNLREKRYGPYVPLGLERLTIILASTGLIGVLLGIAVVGADEAASTRILFASGVVLVLALLGAGLSLLREPTHPPRREPTRSWSALRALVVIVLLTVAYYLLKALI